MIDNLQSIPPQHEFSYPNNHLPALRDLSLLPEVASVDITSQTENRICLDIMRQDNTAVSITFRPPHEDDFQRHAGAHEEASQNKFLIVETIDITTQSGCINILDHFHQMYAAHRAKPTVAVRALNDHIRSLPKKIIKPPFYVNKRDTEIVRSHLLHKPTGATDSRAHFETNTVILAIVPVSDLDIAVLYHELAELAFREEDPHLDSLYTKHAEAWSNLRSALNAAGHSDQGLSPREKIQFINEIHDSTPDSALRFTVDEFLRAYLTHELYRKTKRMQTEEAANTLMIKAIEDLNRSSDHDLIKKRAAVMNYSAQSGVETFILNYARELKKWGLWDEAAKARQSYPVCHQQEVLDAHALLLKVDSYASSR